MALADGERFERSTYGFKVRCSNHLSYPSILARLQRNTEKIRQKSDITQAGTRDGEVGGWAYSPKKEQTPWPLRTKMDSNHHLSALTADALPRF